MTASLTLDTSILEQSLTRTVWWAIPSIWLPVVCYCVLKSAKMGHALPEIALMVVGGVFVWTLLEYTLHRFLFHIKTKSYWLVLSLLAPMH
jgi:dihydroceramide fatty acyl 2-hydroxylase